MWPDTRLSELLGIEHPIIAAPMAGASTPALAAAASNAGGLGSLGCALMDEETVRGTLGETLRLTKRPVNANFFVHKPPERDSAKDERARARLRPYYEELDLGEVPAVAPSHFPFDRKMLAAVLETGPQVVSFHFGLPDDDIMAALKAAGRTVLSSATTVREAEILQRRGADAIIAQGYEAGGHRGFFASSEVQAQVGTMALVPQIVDAVSVPVIAAGGIADGRGIAAAFALGASGVQIGTAFLSTDEAAIAPAYRSALRGAGEEDTRLTRSFSGRPARGLVNRYMEEMAAHENDLPDFPLMNPLTGPLRKAGAERGSPDFMSLWSGQAVRLNREMPAGDLFRSLIAQAQDAMKR